MNFSTDCQLAPLNEADLKAVVDLQHRLMLQKKHWSLEEAKSSLMDHAHRNGNNVLLARDNVSRELVGVGDWSIGENGESFGAPLLAATDHVAVGRETDPWYAVYFADPSGNKFGLVYTLEAGKVPF